MTDAVNKGQRRKVYFKGHIKEISHLYCDYSEIYIEDAELISGVSFNDCIVHIGRVGAMVNFITTQSNIEIDTAIDTIALSSAIDTQNSTLKIRNKPYILSEKYEDIRDLFER
jgi:hypothetical protein